MGFLGFVGGGGGGGGSGTPGGSPTQLQYNLASAFAGVAGSAVDSNGSIMLGGATVTSSDPILSLTQTWNAGAVAFTGYKLNITDTASSASSLLADWQVGGSSVVNFSAKSNAPTVLISGVGTQSNASKPALKIAPTFDGTSTAFQTFTIMPTGANAGGFADLFTIGANGTTYAHWTDEGTLRFIGGTKSITGLTSLSVANEFGAVDQSVWLTASSWGFAGSGFGIGIGVNGEIGFSSTTAAQNATHFDITLTRDAAAILAQRAGTTAQTFRVYNTFTDASNYERVTIGWNSNIFQMFTDSAGTGSSRVFQFGTLGASALQFFTNSSAKWNIPSGNPDISPSIQPSSLGGGGAITNALIDFVWLTAKTIATLPGSPIAGQIAYVTDGDAGLGWGATAVNSGSGATHYHVWYNGTNWTVVGK